MEKTQIAQIALEKLQFISIEEAERNLVLVEGVGYSCYNPELRGTSGIFGFDGGFLMYGGMNATTEDAIESYKQGRRS